jgi:hypothetical protein
VAYGSDLYDAGDAHRRHVAAVLASVLPSRAAIAAEIRREGRRAQRLAIFHPQLRTVASAAEPYERAARIVETWEGEG